MISDPSMQAQWVSLKKLALKHDNESDSYSTYNMDAIILIKFLTNEIQQCL